jgi:hypothetical protein
VKVLILMPELQEVVISLAQIFTWLPGSVRIYAPKAGKRQ